MRFVLHKVYKPVIDMEKMRELYENLVFSDFLLFQYREGNFTFETLVDLINMPNLSITEVDIEQFEQNSIRLNNLFKNWFWSLGFFEDEKSYQRINGLNKIILSAKYGKPFAYRYENLIPVENLVLNNKRNFWQHFYGITCSYNDKEILDRKDKTKRKIAEEKRVEAKEIEPMHAYNIFIEFLCPELNGRILFWGENNKPVSKAKPEELLNFFNRISFYREFLSNSPKISSQNITQHANVVFPLLKEYAQSYITLLSKKHWQVILEFLREYQPVVSNSKVMQDVQENGEVARTQLKDFELMTIFFDANQYLLPASYDNGLYYELNTADKDSYEQWEDMNKHYLDYFAKLIASTEETRTLDKFLNIRALKNTFSERLHHNFFPISKAIVDEWINRRLNYERYLNAEYAIEQTSLYLFKNEGFNETIKSDET